MKAKFQSFFIYAKHLRKKVVFISGTDNLKPVQTEEEAREKGRNGGIKSGEARRRKRDVKNAAKMILNLAAQEGSEKNLQAMGIDEEDFTNRVALLARAYYKGIAGDVNAIKFLFEMAGETPAQQLAEKRFKAEQNKDTPKSNTVDDWIEAVLEADGGQNG